MRFLFVIILSFSFTFSFSQKVDSIYFNLYTDSLKKGFYNYINVDGLMSDGTWLPLDTNHVTLKSNGGFFLGNDLFIDSAYTKDYVTVVAVLKAKPAIKKEGRIYIRKRGFDEVLKTDEEIMEAPRRRRNKGN